MCLLVANGLDLSVLCSAHAQNDSKSRLKDWPVLSAAVCASSAVSFRASSC